MTIQVDALSQWADGLLANLTPQARRRLTRQIAIQLRQSQAKRIAAQLNPDGTPYVPRKGRLRDKRGKVRKAMFTKLRTSRFLKIDNDVNRATIGYSGREGGIANVHQYGLRDRVSLRGGVVRYEVRELLGVSNDETDRILMLLLDSL